jgi:hypothetical protein
MALLTTANGKLTRVNVNHIPPRTQQTYFIAYPLSLAWVVGAEVTMKAPRCLPIYYPGGKRTEG